MGGNTILINKPVGWTSFDVVKKVKNLLKVKKVGHAGTLDPLASGLLILCTDGNTKKISDYQNLDKTYEGVMCIGKTTPSFDLETDFDSINDYRSIDIDDIYNTATKFLGSLEQVPPIYSAIKVNGQRLYKVARKGGELVIKSKTVYIKNFDITNVELPYITFKVICSKGTYVRSLVNDYGKALKGVGAYLSKLNRTMIGSFLLDDAYEISDLENFNMTF